jgi:aryl-alcohol dehydrogenase-like predicted oxidoreductase
MPGRAAGLVLGSAQWGGAYGIANSGGAPDDAELRRIVLRAAIGGARGIDTARAYGASESRIGALGALARRFEIGTKLAPDATPDAAGAREVRERSEASLAASRAALGVERLDALLLHRGAQRHAAGGAAWELLRRERRAGRIDVIGVSALDPDEAWTALDDRDVERIQVAASLLDQRLARGGFFERARLAGKQVQVRSVFLQGVAFLAPDALPPHLEPLRDVLRRVADWAAARALATSDAFLLFARSLGAPLVLGFERAAQLEACLAAWQRPLLPARECAALGALVPELPRELVEPFRWPERAQ